MFIRSTEEPVLVQVVGHSEHGDAYRRITYDRDGKTVLHNRASVRSLSVLQFLCLQMCVYGGGAVPQGGVGDCLPWGGEWQGGGHKNRAAFTGLISASCTLWDTSMMCFEGSLLWC